MKCRIGKVTSLLRQWVTELREATRQEHLPRHRSLSVPLRKVRREAVHTVGGRGRHATASDPTTPDAGAAVPGWNRRNRLGERGRARATTLGRAVARLISVWGAGYRCSACVAKSDLMSGWPRCGNRGHRIICSINCARQERTKNVESEVQWNRKPT